jgi:hypothetical protein
MRHERRYNNSFKVHAILDVFKRETALWKNEEQDHAAVICYSPLQL